MTGQTFRIRDPAYASRVRSSFERQGIMDHLGATLERVEPGRCDIRLPYRPEVSQQHGFFHGGVVGTIADSAAGYAGYTLMPPGSSVLTVEYKINLIAPAEGDTLVARGEVVRPGRTLVVSRADVFVQSSGRDVLCATLLQTLMTMHGRSDTIPSDSTARRPLPEE